MSVYFLASAIRGAFYVAFIRENGMLFDPLIHGSLLTQNLGRWVGFSECVVRGMWRLERLLRIGGALSTLNGYRNLCGFYYC